MRSGLFLLTAACLAAVISCGGSTSSENANPDQSAGARTETPGTEAGLYAAAQAAEQQGRGRDAVDLYRRILTEYPESPQNYKAQFLVGFVFSEVLNQPDSARAAFGLVLERYPESEFADDAQAMLRFLDGEFPSFEETPAP